MTNNSINGGPRNRNELYSNQSSQSKKTTDITGSNNSPAAEQAAKTNGDTVSITSEASKIRELQSSLSNAPDIDMEKVESIKKEIANGNYPIDYEGIADKLLDLEKTLF